MGTMVSVYSVYVAGWVGAHSPILQLMMLVVRIVALQALPQVPGSGDGIRPPLHRTAAHLDQLQHNLDGAVARPPGCRWTVSQSCLQRPQGDMW